MVDNVLVAAIVPHIAKWALMFVGTRNEGRILSDPPVWDAECVLKFAREVYSTWK